MARFQSDVFGAGPCENAREGPKFAAWRMLAGRWCDGGRSGPFVRGLDAHQRGLRGHAPPPIRASGTAPSVLE